MLSKKHSEMTIKRSQFLKMILQLKMLKQLKVIHQLESKLWKLLEPQILVSSEKYSE